MPRRVPAWQVQTGSYTHPDYVFILTDELDELGWPKTKLVDRLTPVDPEQQKRLAAIRPARAVDGPTTTSPMDQAHKARKATRLVDDSRRWAPDRNMRERVARLALQRAERCQAGMHADPDNSGQCIICGAELDEPSL